MLGLPSTDLGTEV